MYIINKMLKICIEAPFFEKFTQKKQKKKKIIIINNIKYKFHKSKKISKY